MNQRKNLICCLLVFAILLGISAGFLSFPVSAATSSEIKKQIQQLKEEKAEIAQQIEKLKGQISENQSEMEKMV